eukprot:gene8432-10351_t
MSTSPPLREQALICQDCVVNPGVKIGGGTILHPKASILNQNGGTIEIGTNNIIEELVTIINTTNEKIIIGSNNLFEVGSVIECKTIGNNNVFEPKCKVSKGVEIGDGCVVSAGTTVPGNEIIQNSTVYSSTDTNVLKFKSDIPVEKYLKKKSHTGLDDIDVQNQSETSEFVVSESKYVEIDEEALEKECKQFADNHKIKPHKEIWADNEFHYCLVNPADESTHYSETTAKYILVLDSLNFCFWPDSELEYHHLARGLKTTLERDPSSFDADRLAIVTPEILNSWFERPLPNPKERCRLLNEVGTALTTHFNGSIKEMILSANHNSANLVDIITKYFWGFRDSCVYKGRQIFFYKRAQIFVGDLWGAFYGKGLGRFDDIQDLTMFADYRVPQILESLGIIKYSKELKEIINSKQVIPVGSEMEIEIRAVTVVAVEKMRKSLNEKQCNLLSLEVDWMLWGRGEAMLDKLPPHHRTLTVFY